jgi:excisionase family DNA binding protein
MVCGMATHNTSSHISDAGAARELAGDLDAGPAHARRLLHAGDVAELLGVPRSLVYALARRGAIPSMRIGERYIRFRYAAILAWLDDQENASRRSSR